jgi:hypothetical protein
VPFYLVWLEGEDGRRHLFDLEPIEAESQEDALKIVMGGSLWLSPEESRQVETMELVRRFDEQAERDDEPSRLCVGDTNNRSGPPTLSSQHR